MGNSKSQLRALTVGSKPDLKEVKVEVTTPAGQGTFYVRSIPYGDKSKIDDKATNIDFDDDGNKTVEFDNFHYETQVLIKSVYSGPQDDPEAEQVFSQADLERIRQQGLDADSWLYLLMEPAKKLNKRGGNFKADPVDSETGNSAE